MQLFLVENRLECWSAPLQMQVTTGSGGLVIDNPGYDAFGKRRQVMGADDTSNTLASKTHYGYTGQLHLEDAELIHLNGRVYDPQLARFLSPDPVIQAPKRWPRKSEQPYK